MALTAAVLFTDGIGGRPVSGLRELQAHHKKIIFPAPLIDPVCKIPVKWHGSFVETNVVNPGVPGASVAKKMPQRR